MSAPFERIAKEILPGWDISLAFVDADTAQSLNVRLRGKAYVPNVLSYVVGKKNGEVIICKEIAQRDAPNFALSVPDFILLLFIHALLHLEGRRHGTTMEKREWFLLRKWKASRTNTHGTSHRNRNRRRHLSSENSRRRRDR